MKPYLIMLCTLLTVARAHSEWPTYHGGPTLAGATDSRIPGNLRRLWRFDMGSEIQATPIAANDRIFCLAKEGPLTAFSLAGEERWSQPFPADQTFVAPPIYVSGNIITASEQGIVYAVDAADGEIRWQYNAGEKIQGSPNWVDTEEKVRLLVVGQSSGGIHCLDLEKGSLVWKINETNRCDGSPAISNSELIFGNCDAALYKYSTATGNLEGEVDLGPEGQVAGGVALFEGAAFVGTHGGSLVGIDTEETEILWRFEDAKSPVYTTPAVNAEYVVFALENGTLFCLDKPTGSVNWQKDTYGDPRSPVIAADKVVVSSSGQLQIYSISNGNQLWSYDVSDAITSPAIVGGMIIVGSSDGNLWAFGGELESAAENDEREE